MTRLNDLIKRRQVTAFFLVAFVISWTTWLIAPSLSAGDDDTKLVITLIGVYSPALAAMFVSGVVNPEPSGIQSNRRWRVFILVFLFANLVWFLSTEKFGRSN